MKQRQLILASASPRRHELLTRAGFTFTVHPADIDETQLPDELPKPYVARLAATKAAAILKRFPAALVLAADTTVVLDGEIFNKPIDLADAERMLRSLSGREHYVHTGVHLAGADIADHFVVTTGVTFGEIDEPSLAQYLALQDSLDKAGAYGIQGFASRWITHLDGDFSNVMGLPVSEVSQRLLAHGVPRHKYMPPNCV